MATASYTRLRARLSGPVRRLWGRVARSRPGRRIAALLAHRRAPLVLLGLLCVVAVGVRVWHLGNPPRQPGTGYVFDERYYISAARVIAGLPNNYNDAYYHASPKGTDPNGEHPQLGKLVIAASLSLFGDNSIAWRLTAVIFGIAALLLLYWLVRSARGSPWLALGVTAIASFDNLWLVHSRIAVLDIYVVPFMLAGVALYLRRRILLAGIVIGIACCVKEFGVYTPIVLFVFELIRCLGRLAGRRAGAGMNAGARAVLRQLARPVLVGIVAGITFFSVLSLLDTLVTPWSGGHPVDRNQSSFCNHLLIWRDGCNHFVFMNNYAGRLKSEKGIASAPTEWWIDHKRISYYTVTTTVSAHGKVLSQKKIVWFRGEISQVLLFTSWLALALCLWWAIRRRDEIAALALAWALGTWLPPEIFHLADDRTTYIYYMVVTMPALYLAAGRLLAARRIPWLLVAIWAGVFLWDFWSLYPFRTLSGM